MPVIALNGILILVPSAFFLAARAGAGQFDTAFYAVQAVELLAGAVNIALMSLNMRDGFAMTRQAAERQVRGRCGPCRHERRSAAAFRSALPKNARIAVDELGAGRQDRACRCRGR